jgi:Pyruvate/2-oxoacid:ferredoxin oxidoreductase delta subunit
MAEGKKREVKSVRVAAPLCNGCGICREACETRAIRMGNVARIVTERCTGCGVCVEKCQTGAIVAVGDSAGED